MPNTWETALDLVDETAQDASSDDDVEKNWDGESCPTCSDDGSACPDCGIETEADDDELQPNRGPAMRTAFGRDVSPERVKKGDLHGAYHRYNVFHDKDPHRAVELKHDLPSKLVPIGELKSVMYRTDKWKEDGDDEDYKHVDDPGVRVYEPAHLYKKNRVEGRGNAKTNPPKVVGPPVRYPKALTLLGYCLGFFVERDDDGEIYECNPRDTYLFCSPSGNMLALYSPNEGFLCVMAGGRLRVEKDGIDG